MTNLFSKFAPEDIEFYREAAAEAGNIDCAICEKTIGYQDWQSLKEDHNKQEREFFLCVKCFGILSRMEEKK